MMKDCLIGGGGEVGKHLALSRSGVGEQREYLIAMAREHDIVEVRGRPAYESKGNGLFRAIDFPNFNARLNSLLEWFCERRKIAVAAAANVFPLRVGVDSQHPVV